ncbi:hypothetical protein JCM10213_000055 [Rhodosporidiobolus nylandii]
MPTPPVPPELVWHILEGLYADLAPDARGRTAKAVPWIKAGDVYGPLRLVSRAWDELALPFLLRNFGSPDPLLLVILLARFNQQHAVQEVSIVRPKGPRAQSIAQMKNSWPAWRSVLAKVAPSLCALRLDAPEWWWGDRWLDEARSILAIPTDITFSRLTHLTILPRHPSTYNTFGPLLVACPHLESLAIDTDQPSSLIDHAGVMPALRKLSLSLSVTGPSSEFRPSDLQYGLEPLLQYSRETLVELSVHISGELWRCKLAAYRLDLVLPAVTSLRLTIRNAELPSNLFERFPQCQHAELLDCTRDPTFSYLLALPPTLLTLSLSLPHARDAPALLNILSIHSDRLLNLQRLALDALFDDETWRAIAAGCDRLGIELFTPYWAQEDELAYAEVVAHAARVREAKGLAVDDEEDEEEDDEGNPLVDDWDAEDGLEFRHLWSEEKRRAIGVMQED